MRGSREGQGPGTPWKYHKNIGFLSNTIIYLDRLKNHKAIKPTNIGQSVARQRNAIKIAFRWRGGGGGGGRRWPPFSTIWILSSSPPSSKKMSKTSGSTRSTYIPKTVSNEASGRCNCSEFV